MRIWQIPLLLISLLLCHPAQAEEVRLALVIGNSSYSGKLGKLNNAARDAGLIAELLRKAGFEVDERKDLGHQEMSREIGLFGKRVKAAGPQAVALFYFAGHGFQLTNSNYLIGIDVPVGSESEIAEYGTNSLDVLDTLIASGAETSILILDACRGDRLGDELKTLAQRGLAIDQSFDTLEPEQSVLLAYSTGKGQFAFDGVGRNGPYATALSQHLPRDGIPLEILFRNVRKSMVSQGFPKPWESNGMQRAFSFFGAPPEEDVQPVRNILPGQLVQVGDFGLVPTGLGIDGYVPAARYLRKGNIPMTIREVSPPDSEIAFFNTAQLYQGKAFKPSISGNVLTQIETGNVPASFTLAFDRLAARIRFQRPSLIAATESGITFPAWKATALSADDEVLDIAEEEMIRSFVDVEERNFNLRGQDGKGIAAVRFESDPRLNGVPFTAFSAILIEAIYFEAMP